MARYRSVDLDCVLELLDGAEALGDEYLSTLLRLASARLVSRVLGEAP